MTIKKKEQKKRHIFLTKIGQEGTRALYLAHFIFVLINVVKVPLKCWEPQIRQKFDGKISLKFYQNVTKDII